MSQKELERLALMRQHRKATNETADRCRVGRVDREPGRASGATHGGAKLAKPPWVVGAMYAIRGPHLSRRTQPCRRRPG
jgi:hypothetical protein